MSYVSHVNSDLGGNNKLLYYDPIGVYTGSVTLADESQNYDYLVLLLNNGHALTLSPINTTIVFHGDSIDNIGVTPMHRLSITCAGTSFTIKQWLYWSNYNVGEYAKHINNISRTVVKIIGVKAAE